MDADYLEQAWSVWEEACANPPPPGERRRVDHGAAVSEAYFSMEMVRYALNLTGGMRLYLADAEVASGLDDLTSRHRLETEVRSLPDADGNGDLILNQEGTYLCRLQPERFFAVPERTGKELLGQLMALYLDHVR